MDNKKQEPLNVTDAAYQILREHKAPMHYRQLITAALERMGADPNIPGSKLAQIHTEINLDSRFNFLGKGMWGLHAWSAATVKHQMNAGPSERSYQPKAADYLWDEEEEEELDDEEESFIPDDEDLDDEDKDELDIDDLLDAEVEDLDDLDDEEEEPVK